MMDILMSETCWVHKKWNKITSDIKLVFYSSAITSQMLCCNFFTWCGLTFHACCAVSARIAKSQVQTLSQNAGTNLVFVRMNSLTVEITGVVRGLLEVFELLQSYPAKVGRCYRHCGRAFRGQSIEEECQPPVFRRCSSTAWPWKTIPITLSNKISLFFWHTRENIKS